MTSLHIMLEDPPHIRVQQGGRYIDHLVPWLRNSQRGRENSGKCKDCVGTAYDWLSTGLPWQIIVATFTILTAPYFLGGCFSPRAAL